MTPSKMIAGFMRLFFRLLYHSLAWSYDLVAAAVSLGRWQGWVRASVSLLAGPRVLELGYGPGHLQESLYAADFHPYGLDESRQMAQQAHQRLVRRGYRPGLARGMAQALPYADQTFDCVVATFPTRYITDPNTLREVRRVIKPNGRLVVLMATWITGKGLPDRLMRELFRVTAESPPEDQDIAGYLDPYIQAGFQASLRFIEQPGSRLLFILAKKPG